MAGVTGDLDGEEVGARFALGRVLEPARAADRGQQGVVWRLVTSRGAFAVKELDVAVTEDDARLSADFAERMRARGVHAPVAMRTPQGAVLARCGPRLVRVETWVELAPPTAGLDPQAVGLLLATLHRDPLPAVGPVDPWYTEPVAPTRWDDLADRLDRAGAPFAAALREQAQAFLAQAELFLAPSRVQLCHRDLWEDNVRPAAGGLCVIDWDNCGPADAVQEVGVALAGYAGGDPHRARRLAVAYRAHGGGSLPSEPGHFTMAMAQFAHFAETAAARWLNAVDEPARARAEAWFREGYDEPFELEQIERVIDAVTGL